MLGIGTPAGFSTPSSNQQITATVTAPNINISNVRVGRDLETSVFISLAATVVVICRLLLGVEKPPGGLTVIVLVPFATGWNAVLTNVSPPVNGTAPVVMVPTLVLELVTGTLIGASAPRPPRRLWTPAELSVVGSRRAGAIVIVVLAEKVVV
ncbi:MAG: hypothetical protein DMG07_27490, partial [Acidobacteria bacterium]